MKEPGVEQPAAQGLGCHLDLEALAELQDLLEEDFVTLLEEFIDSSAQASAELSRQIQQQNHTAIRTAAHSLKGSALNIGAPALGACWAALEDAAVQVATAVQLQALWQPAQSELELTTAALRAQFF